MRIVPICCMVLGLFMTLASGAKTQSNPYRSPLQPSAYKVNTVAVEPSQIGSLTLRDAPALAAEVLVEVDNYFPRALEPILLIAGEPAGFSAGIAEVRDDGMTVLRFIVDDPSMLKGGGPACGPNGR